MRYEDSNALKMTKIFEKHQEDCDFSNPRAPGAILLGVCRARMSEGIDFKDS